MTEESTDLEGFDAAMAASADPGPDLLKSAKGLFDRLGVQAGLDMVLEAAQVLVNAAEYFKDPKVRWALRRANNRPGGLVALLVRRKIRQKLPAAIATDEAATLTIQIIALMV